MTPDGQEPLHDRLSRLIASDHAVPHLRRYFGVGPRRDATAFTGARFESLAGGGDRQAVADTVTADDLIAVQTLSVRVPAQAALDLLEGDLGGRMTDLLRAVPTGLDMVEAGAADLDADSSAHQAWVLLCKQRGIGWVTAGKLLARKRPRLVPVYDEVVRCALDRPKSPWLGLRTALRADDRALHRELAALRRAAGLTDAVSVLRVCDVVLWMGHREEHRKKGCAGT
ncbi:DUF6308 family protein [Streptomyces collinus]|uniref:DUF6308 family protein n=1 Tax=Streptomyces collinus TaxID=42684 RepID=UPI003693C90B